MSSTDAAIADAECIFECLPRGYQLPVLISIFARLANMSTDTNALIAGATCIECNIPPGMQLPVLISLAQQIVAGGGGGGGSSCLSRSVGPPVAPPAFGCTVAICITDTGAWYFWDDVSLQWIAFA